MAGLGAFLDELGERYGERVALLGASAPVSFAELAAGSRQAAKGLASLGVNKGSRVGILMPNSPTWLSSAFAAWRLGAMVVPLNTLLLAPELHYALRFADVSTLILADQFLKHDYLGVLYELGVDLDHNRGPIRSATLPALRSVIVRGASTPPASVPYARLTELGAPCSDAWLDAAQAQVVASEPATIFFTSGTTAAPKGAVHTHASMLTAAANVAARLGLDADDRTWGYLPFFFTGGLVAVALATLSRGGAVILQEVFEAGATLRLLSEHHCTTFFAWPHQAEALIQHPDFARTPLHIRKGPGAQTAWAARLLVPDHQAVGTWGMTESGPMAASTRHDDPLAERAGAHGRPMPGLEFRIIDPDSGRGLGNDAEGELCVRGSSLMAQYYKVPRGDCFDAEGFFHTGDLARIDANGLLHFIGRLKDVIKTAGVNVAAAEVEALLMQHPHVRVAHVVGVPHPVRGENVAAFVVGIEPNATDALLAFCRERLASYKVPRHLFVCTEDQLPVLGSGKIDKRALRARAAQQVDRLAKA